MASNSIIYEAQIKYDSLTAANFPSATRPSIYMDSVPQASATGQVRPPFVLIRDSGRRPRLQSDTGGIEDGSFTLSVYALTVADVDLTVKAIKWNGGSPALKLGFDFGTLDLSSPIYHIEMRRTNERRSFAGFEYQSQRVHMCELTYQVISGLSPTI